MTLSAALARPFISPRGIPRDIDIRDIDIVRSPKVKAAIMRGIEDLRVGRARPWSEVRKEFGV